MNAPLPDGAVPIPDGNAAQPADAVVRQAAQWCATVHGGQADAAELSACRRWRDERPEHELAYRRMEALWGGFDSAAYASPGAARRIISGSLAPSPSLRARKTTVVLAVAMLAAACLGLQLAPPAWLLADHRSGAGEWRVVELPDHSRVTLNTDSAIDVRYDGARRLIELRRGEILVEVASEDGRRPFIVQTRDGTARAMGTRYVVRLEAEHTDVSVTESTVQACASAPGTPCARLAAGQRARLSPTGLSALPDLAPDVAESWARATLVVDNRPVAEVLGELARYRRGRLSYDERALAGLRVSGVFPLEDTDQALQALSATLPLTVRRYTSWWVSIAPR